MAKAETEEKVGSEGEGSGLHISKMRFQLVPGPAKKQAGQACDDAQTP